MSKSYLNSKEKTQVTYVYMALSVLDDLVKKNIFSKNENTQFKHAVTRMTNGLTQMILRLGEDTAKRIDRDIRDSQITLVPKMKVQIDKPKVAITEDKILVMVEKLISAYCMDCHESDFKKCEIFEINQNLDIDSIFNEPEGICPYSYMIEQLSNKENGNE